MSVDRLQCAEFLNETRFYRRKCQAVSGFLLKLRHDSHPLYDLCTFYSSIKAIIQQPQHYKFQLIISKILLYTHLMYPYFP